MSTKRRLSVSVDAEVADAGQRAVDSGAAPTLSARVNDALHARAARDRRLRALDDYEREFEATAPPRPRSYGRSSDLIAVRSSIAT